MQPHMCTPNDQDSVTSADVQPPSVELEVHREATCPVPDASEILRN
jgi:hypothetical protein